MRFRRGSRSAGAGYDSTDERLEDWSQPERDPVFHRALKKYRREFPDKTGRSWFGGDMANLLKFYDESVTNYFNNDLARAMAAAAWAARSEALPRRQRYYLLEDATVRHCACWEYVFQMLVHVLGLNEAIQASKVGRDRMLGLAAYDIQFLPSESGTSVEYTPRKHREALRHIRRRRQELDYLRVGSRADQFFRRAGREFAKGSWLDEFKAFARSQPVKQVRQTRDTISHNHALGAGFRTTSGAGPIPGNWLSASPGGGPDPEEVMRTLSRAHEELSKAVHLVRLAILGTDIPNTKATEGVEYFVREYQCSECQQKTLVPVPDPAECGGKTYCQNCGLWPPTKTMVIGSQIQAPEIVYGSLLRERIVDCRGSLSRSPRVDDE